MHRRCPYGPINSYHSFLWSNLILCLYNVDTFNICMKEFGLEIIFFDEHMHEGVWFRKNNF